MDDTDDDTPDNITTRYFYWEGEPARIHHEGGTLTADAYRAGTGIVKVDPMEVYYKSYEISEARYKDLVLQATGLGRRSEQG